MNKTINSIPFLLSVGIFLLYGCEKDEDPGSDESYTDIMAMQLKSDLVDDASISPYEAIFDVSPAFNQGHLPFASNAGSVDGLGNLLDGLDKSKAYLVYCHSDGPSIAGAELMAKNGFSNVHRLESNYAAWDDLSFIDMAASMVKLKIDAGEFEAIFDVSPMFNVSRLPGATNAKESGGGTDLSELIEGMDKTKSYLVYCHSDSPAMAGAQLMEDAGFKNVFRLEGNFGAWVDAGYDVE
jgi:rhodanese-related sulfurtransferase